MSVNLYQAARHLGVFPRTVVKWIDAGYLKATGTGLDRNIRVEDLNAFCRDREFSEYRPEPQTEGK